MKPCFIYELESENLMGLGGPMGTERTWTNWSRAYESLALAKAAAAEDYQKQRTGENIRWSYKGGKWSTQDLLFVMYHVRKIKVIGEGK